MNSINHYIKEISYEKVDYKFYSYLSNNPLMALQELLGDYVSNTKIAIDKIKIEGDSIWIIDNIYVSDSLRGLGVGKNLLEMFFESSKNDSKEVFLVADLTINNNFYLLDFYEKFGFKIVHSYENYVLMKK